jgi:outer membrane protein assembly factor BamD (BamD/ComL family)
MIKQAPVARIALLVALTLTAAIGPLPASAQEPVPVIEDAELIFTQGVEAFEAGDFGMAFRRFRLLTDTYELNRKTTASLLMAAKALYRDGRYEDAMELTETLEETYPTSGYVDEARELRSLAEAQRERAEAGDLVSEIGIVLPLQDEHATLTQALFTGVRIAVDEHNRLNPERPVRMVFRDTEADPAQASSAVADLAGSGVDAMIGPLYSGEAMAAAEAAEQSETVLIAPLANDEAVSEGREFVFQANPTITTRGRLMARFATRGLLLDNFGIIAERDRDQISERMAEGFLEEAMLNGEEVHFYTLLESPGDWSRLAEIVGADTLRRARAVYMPIAGGESIARIDGALSSLDKMGMSNQIRVLGNTEWHDAPNASRASRYETTYTSDFHIEEDDASVSAFRERFENIVGDVPDPSTTIGRLAFTGYDVARFLIPLATDFGDDSLVERIRGAGTYQGLGIRVNFSEGNVNDALYYFRYQDGGLRLLR